jgi:hypothetical protein
LLRRFDHVPGFIFTGKKKNNLIQKKRTGNFGSERQKGDGKMKKSLYVSAVAFVAMVFLCLPQKGLANLITVHFLGEVTSIASTSNNYPKETDGYFKTGDRFDGYYSYQSGQQPFGQGDPFVSGSYSKYRTEAVTFSVGNVSGAAVGGYLFVYDGYSNSHKDQYGLWVNSQNNHLTANVSPYTLLSFGLALTDSTEKVFDTSALPLTVPDLNDFTSTSLDLTFGQGLQAKGGSYVDYMFVSGKVTVLEQITPITTPEPSSIFLLGSGLIGLVGSRLRRRGAI